MIYTIVIGFIVGIVAKLLFPGKNPGGCITTTLLGIAGSWLGQLLFRGLGMTRPVGFVGSVIGAMLLLGIFHLLANRKA